MSLLRNLDGNDWMNQPEAISHHSGSQSSDLLASPAGLPWNTHELGPMNPDSVHPSPDLRGYETDNHRDSRAIIQDLERSPTSDKRARGRRVRFMGWLRDVLANPDYAHLIRWEPPSYDTVLIPNQEAFTKYVWKPHSKGGKWSSFVKQLNIHKFSIRRLRTQSNSEVQAFRFSHEDRALFQKDNPRYVHLIRRAPRQAGLPTPRIGQEEDAAGDTDSPASTLSSTVTTLEELSVAYMKLQQDREMDRRAIRTLAERVELLTSALRNSSRLPSPLDRPLLPQATGSSAEGLQITRTSHQHADSGQQFSLGVTGNTFANNSSPHISDRYMPDSFSSPHDPVDRDWWANPMAFPLFPGSDPIAGFSQATQQGLEPSLTPADPVDLATSSTQTTTAFQLPHQETVPWHPGAAMLHPRRCEQRTDPSLNQDTLQFRLNSPTTTTNLEEQQQQQHQPQRAHYHVRLPSR